MNVIVRAGEASTVWHVDC